MMAAATENAALIGQVVAYVIELYRELTEENGAPTLGTQNRVADFILADPELREAVAAWARTAETDEATTQPSPRLPDNPAYRRIRAHMESIVEPALFVRSSQDSGDRR
jgi:hypothetical protein